MNDELEAISETIDTLGSVENPEMRQKIEAMLDIHDHHFPLCSNAYRRKMKAAYASVCDCCIFSYHYHLFSCRDILKYNNEKVWKQEWVDIFLEYLQRLKNELS